MVLVCILLTGIKLNNTKSISQKTMTGKTTITFLISHFINQFLSCLYFISVLKNKNGNSDLHMSQNHLNLQNQRSSLKNISKLRITDESGGYVDDPNLLQALMTNVIIKSTPYKRSNGTRDSDLKWKKEKFHKRKLDDEKQNIFTRELGIPEESHMTISLVGSGEIDSENFENSGVNLYPQLSIDKKSVNSDDSVYCIKLSSDDVLCSHGDYSYRISLPDQNMSRESIEDLVSSIYKNIELGNNFGTRSDAAAKISPNQMDEISNNPKSADKRMPIVKSNQYLIQGPRNSINKESIKNSGNSNEQIVTFTLPIKRGSEPDSKSNLPPNAMLQTGSNQMFSSKEFELPLKKQFYPRYNVRKINTNQIPQGEFNVGNSKYIAVPHYFPLKQGGEFRLYPVTLNSNQSNPDSIEDDYQSKWLTRRQNMVQTFPYRVLLVRGKNLNKREVNFDKSSLKKIIDKRAIFKDIYCTRKFVTTCRCSVNCGRKGPCAPNLGLCPVRGICPCKAVQMQICDPTTCPPIIDDATPCPTRCPCYNPPPQEACIPPSDNATAKVCAAKHPPTTTECCPTVSEDLSLMIAKPMKSNDTIKENDLQQKKILNKGYLHPRQRRKYFHSKESHMDGINGEQTLKEEVIKTRHHKCKKSRECSCNCGYCHCKKKKKQIKNK